MLRAPSFDEFLIKPLKVEKLGPKLIVFKGERIELEIRPSPEEYKDIASRVKLGDFVFLSHLLKRNQN